MNKSFLDPVIGARWTATRGDRHVFRVSGLVGGFDIGEASDLIYGFDVLYGRRLSESRTLYLGYRYLSIDYDEGSGANRFEIDIDIQGPIVGLAFIL